MEDQKVLKILVDDSIRDSIKEMKILSLKISLNFVLSCWRNWEKC